MRIHYPRSFLKLALGGYVLVGLPLLAGLLFSALALDRLATQSQRAVYQAAQATHGSRALVDEVIDMERSVRQFVILGDPALLAGYIKARHRFLDTARQLSGLPMEAAQRRLLARLRDREADLHARITASRGGAAALPDRVGDFTELSEIARQMASHGDALIDREVESLREMATRAKQTMAWLLLAVVPVAALLVAGTARLIARPVRQIDAAIRRMGGGELAEPVRVEGPLDLKSLGERLDWMRQRLLEVEAQKVRFLRHVSHDLKTPLTALRESAALLAEEAVGPLSEGQREIVDILQQNCAKLQKLIEDLLDYSALQSGPSILRIAPVNLRELLERVLADHRPALLAKGLRTELACPDDPIRADAEKLRIIVDNLVSNAVRYSPTHGRLKVQGTALADSLQLDVVDEGPGVAPEDKQRVFDAFYQGRPAAGAPVRGSGLGLSIAREYAQAHGGDIAIIDSPQGGAQFRLSLPMRPVGERT